MTTESAHSIRVGWEPMSLPLQGHHDRFKINNDGRETDLYLQFGEDEPIKLLPGNERLFPFLEDLPRPVRVWTREPETTLISWQRWKASATSGDIIALEHPQAIQLMKPTGRMTLRVQNGRSVFLRAHGSKADPVEVRGTYTIRSLREFGKPTVWASEKTRIDYQVVAE